MLLTNDTNAEDSPALEKVGHSAAQGREVKEAIGLT